MPDDRVNIKVQPHVHEELDAHRDMPWPDYLLHLKRLAERESQTGTQAVLDRLDDLEARLPRKVAEELRG